MGLPTELAGLAQRESARTPPHSARASPLQRSDTQFSRPGWFAIGQMYRHEQVGERTNGRRSVAPIGTALIFPFAAIIFFFFGRDVWPALDGTSARHYRRKTPDRGR